jgi:hypothetical protein
MSRLKRRALAITDAMNVLPGRDDASGAWLIAAGYQFEQRSLAGTVRPHDADDSGLRHDEISLQAERRGAIEQSACVDLAQVLHREQGRRGHGHIPSS